MKKTILSLAFIAFSVFLFNSCDTAQSEKFIGLQLYSLRNLMNEQPAETVKQVGEMGYGFVEAAGYRDGKFYGSADPRRPNALAKGLNSEPVLE